MKAQNTATTNTGSKIAKATAAIATATLVGTTISVSAPSLAIAEEAGQGGSAQGSPAASAPAQTPVAPQQETMPAPTPVAEVTVVETPVVAQQESVAPEPTTANQAEDALDAASQVASDAQADYEAAAAVADNAQYDYNQANSNFNQADKAVDAANRAAENAVDKAQEDADTNVNTKKEALDAANSAAQGVTQETVAQADKEAADKAEEASKAEAAARQAQNDLPKANNEKDTADANLDKARNDYNQQLDAANPDGEVTLTPDQAVGAVNNAQTDVNNAQKTLDDYVNSTQPIRDQAHRGSIGFFDSEFSAKTPDGVTVTNQRSQAAIDILTNTSVMEQNTNTVLSSYTELDADGHYVNATDAITLRNMLRALNWIEWCNEHVRKPNGLPEYKVTHSLMASAQRNANFSTLYDEHGYPHAVPSVWTYNAENMAYGCASPSAAYDMWFTREKAVWEQAVLNDPQLADHVSDLASYNPNLYHQVGHYLNLLDSSYVFTGLGINNSNYASIQHFAASVGSETVYTVAEYRALFDDYYKTHVTDIQDTDTTNFTTLQHAKQTLDAAKKQAAYVIAKAMVDAPSTLTDSETDFPTLLGTLNSNLAKATTDLLTARANADAAAQKVQDLNDIITNAFTARNEADIAREEYNRQQGLLDEQKEAQDAYNIAREKQGRAAALTADAAKAGTITDADFADLNAYKTAIEKAEKERDEAQARCIKAKEALDTATTDRNAAYTKYMDALADYAMAKSTFDRLVDEETKALAHRIALNLDPAGGTLSGLPVLHRVGRGLYAIDSLPIPTRPNFAFVGWIAEDGTQVTGADGKSTMLVRLSDDGTWKSRFLTAASEGAEDTGDASEISDTTLLVARWEKAPATDGTNGGAGLDGMTSETAAMRLPVTGGAAVTAATKTVPAATSAAVPATGDATGFAGIVATVLGTLGIGAGLSRRKRD